MRCTSPHMRQQFDCVTCPSVLQEHQHQQGFCRVMCQQQVFRSSRSDCSPELGCNVFGHTCWWRVGTSAVCVGCVITELLIIIIIINPCKPYLTASAPRLTHWGGGK
jgi:hypothetical protein